MGTQAQRPTTTRPAPGVSSDSGDIPADSPRRIRDEVVPPTMRAIVQTAYGSAEVLRLDVTGTPAMGKSDVLIKVHAAGLDRGTWHFMTGRPYLMRVMGFGFRRPKNPVAGVDVAGTVVAVGAAVTRFAVGDEVFGMSRGSFAEYAAAPENKLAHKPAGCSFEQAAVVPISGGTALQALRAGHLEQGQKVLIIGASGGVGSYAVQLAKAIGADVTGVCSTDKVDLVRSLGAERVIDYTRDDFADGTHRYDLIIDIGGNAALSRLRRALTPGGTAVIVGGESRGNLTGGIDRQLRGVLLTPFIGQRITGLVSKERSSDLEVLAGYLQDGSVVPATDRSYPLDQVRNAMRRMENGQVRGKVAITI